MVSSSNRHAAIDFADSSSSRSSVHCPSAKPAAAAGVAFNVWHRTDSGVRGALWDHSAFYLPAVGDVVVGLYYTNVEYSVFDDAERALLMADDPSIAPVERAFARLVVARVLSERGEDPQRIRELFDQAQEALTDHEAPAERQLVAELAKRHGWEIVASPPPSSDETGPE